MAANTWMVTLFKRFVVVLKFRIDLSHKVKQHILCALVWHIREFPSPCTPSPFLYSFLKCYTYVYGGGHCSLRVCAHFIFRNTPTRKNGPPSSTNAFDTFSLLPPSIKVDQ